MADRSPSPHRRVRSRRPAPKAAESDLSPLRVQWVTFRWLVRTEMAICLHLSLSIVLLAYDIPTVPAMQNTAWFAAIALLIVFGMCRLWRRKRLPAVLFWGLLLLGIYLLINALDIFEKREIELQRIEEMRRLEQIQVNKQEVVSLAFQLLRSLF